jgi:hypothetical protein
MFPHLFKLVYPSVEKPNLVVNPSSIEMHILAASSKFSAYAEDGI